jgi:hypothetical protein
LLGRELFGPPSYVPLPLVLLLHTNSATLWPITKTKLKLAPYSCSCPSPAYQKAYRTAHNTNLYGGTVNKGCRTNVALFHGDGLYHIERFCCRQTVDIFTCNVAYKRHSVRYVRIVIGFFWYLLWECSLPPRRSFVCPAVTTLCLIAVQQDQFHPPRVLTTRRPETIVSVSVRNKHYCYYYYCYCFHPCYRPYAGYLQLHTWNKTCFYGIQCCSYYVITICATCYFAREICFVLLL